ncbi:MAG: hypothetical protein WAU32_11455 [Thermoanaerobaculia bacterium]
MIMAVAFVVLLASQSSNAIDRCADALPPSLADQLRRQYPGYSLVTEALLDPHDREAYQKDHPNGCPGVARLDFYGDGGAAYAVLLVRPSRAPREALLLVARSASEAPWAFRKLGRVDIGAVPVIYSLPAGQYWSADASEHAEFKGEVVAEVAFEAWSSIFGWTGSRVKSIVTSD